MVHVSVCVLVRVWVCVLVLGWFFCWFLGWFFCWLMCFLLCLIFSFLPSVVGSCGRWFVRGPPNNTLNQTCPAQPRRTSIWSTRNCEVKRSIDPTCSAPAGNCFASKLQRLLRPPSNASKSTIGQSQRQGTLLAATRCGRRKGIGPVSSKGIGGHWGELGELAHIGATCACAQ